MGRVGGSGGEERQNMGNQILEGREWSGMEVMRGRGGRDREDGGDKARWVELGRRRGRRRSSLGVNRYGEKDEEGGSERGGGGGRG